mmetsp:Transcript_17596/g.41028  ORF Transcript_17596/g.41028 Transcript_17596/m.41028 type:complete len:501 (+) Transcript_17596:2-1504(+)
MDPRKEKQQGQATKSIGALQQKDISEAQHSTAQYPFATMSSNNNNDKYANRYDEEQMMEQKEQEQNDDNVDVDYDEENEALLGDVAREWAGETSMHGVHLASDSESYSLWFRVLWIFLVVASGGVLIWQIEKLIRDYEKFDVSTAYDIKSPSTSLDFPEVTVCNLNLFSATLQNETGILAPTNEQELESISVPLEDFIYYTQFNLRPDVDVNTVWRPVITDFGRCWQFSTNETVAYPGRDNGLHFTAWLGQDDFALGGSEQFGYNSDYAGIVIFVQQKGTTINHQLPSVTVAAGQQSIISIKRTQFNREKKRPWSKCTSQAPEYTQPKCRNNCLNAGMANFCGCRFISDFDRTDLDYCNFWTTDEEFATCWNDFNDTATLAQCNENDATSCAEPPCENTLFETIGTEVDHSQAFLEDFNETFVNNNVDVFINYGTLQYEVFTENPTITFATLLGSIGGSMGLFLGISVVSIIEIFGDLLCLRVLPRGCGIRRLYGLGGRR